MASYNKKEHLRANIEAIKTVFALHREQRTATPEERTVLEAYTGFGALKCILSPANTMEDIARWNKSELELFPLVMELHRTIRDNTTSESQYKSYMQSLKNSVMTAFYTPAPVVREIAASLREAGIVPKRILDPSAGMGEFIRSFDTIAAEGHTTFGFEKDILTGQMLSALHPKDKIRIRGFEEIETKLNGFSMWSAATSLSEMWPSSTPFSARRQNLPERSPACPCTITFSSRGWICSVRVACWRSSPRKEL